MAGLAVAAVPAATHRLQAARGNVRPHRFTQQAARRRSAWLPVLRRGAVAPRASASPPSDQPTFKNAREAIEKSDEVFKGGRAQEALQGFLAAIEMRPNSDEARAAHYNAACCYTALGQWEEAADQLIIAVNDYDLKFSVAIKDPDLVRLREQKVFDNVISSVKGGLSEGAFIKARAEAKSPFRLFRTIVLSGLSAGAAVGLVIIIGRLVASLKGGDGAPDLQESLQNLGINSGVLAVLLTVLINDRNKAAKERGVIEREEVLGKLMVNVNDDRNVTLQTLRSFSRPLIIAGTRTHVQKSMKAAEPYRSAIKDRGIELVPLVLAREDPADRITALKAELAAEEASRPKAQGFGKASLEMAEQAPQMDDDAPGRKGVNKYNVQVGKKKLVPLDTGDWEAWLESIREASGTKEDNVFVQVQLDGSVRSSGVGMPPWEKLMKDIPEMDDMRSKLMN